MSCSIPFHLALTYRVLPLHDKISPVEMNIPFKGYPGPMRREPLDDNPSRRWGYPTGAPAVIPPITD